MGHPDVFVVSRAPTRCFAYIVSCDPHSNSTGESQDSNFTDMETETQRVWVAPEEFMGSVRIQTHILWTIKPVFVAIFLCYLKLPSKLPFCK
jgi:hypothetical protein